MKQHKIFIDEYYPDDNDYYFNIKLDDTILSMNFFYKQIESESIKININNATFCTPDLIDQNDENCSILHRDMSGFIHYDSTAFSYFILHCSFSEIKHYLFMNIGI
jgi:hypothetical protein